MNRTDRLYALVEELRARAPRPVTAPELARRFEVSVRTVERDIQALLEAGVPIWTERGRRTVEAHGLYTSDGTWALVAWCRLRDGGRVFRLDRIVDVTPTAERVPDRDFAEVLGWMPPNFHEPDVVE